MRYCIYKYNDPYIQFKSIKYCDKCKELFLSYDFKYYAIKYDYNRFEL